MTRSHPPLPRLWIVGAGRLGLSLGLMLHRAGAVHSLVYGGRGAAPPAHPLFQGPAPAARYRPGLEVPAPPPTAILLAVPDGAIGEVAERLARLDALPAVPVLHLSGVLGSGVLEPLARRGCPAGSLHPLAAVSDPVQGAERLRGAWWALEGEAEARELGERIVEAAEGQLLPVRGDAKPLYHAAAVFASNYVVALLAVAEGLMGQAGVPAAEARAALAGLAGGAVENVARRGPVAALTGPVARGDRETVELHLARLSPSARALYSTLAREALALARAQGLDPARASRLDEALGGEA